ncbi:MAG: polymer-forming cytoskeletal protein [Bacteroidales bacterium]|nr:polymer-forming cytoskeletal protein [Bacteroidales bacterium]
MSKPETLNDTAKANAVSRISAGSTFKGDLITPYDVRIDGNYEGNIKCQSKVIVGSGAQVGGSIECADLDLWGKFKGDITATNILSLKDGCQVEGNLNVKKFLVELGVSFNGTCKMITEKKAAAVASQEVK